MIKYIRKHWFLFTVVFASSFVFLFQPQIELTALSFTGRNFLNFLFMLTPVFICIGLVDVWIEKETIVRILGNKSGIKGVFVSVAFGMATAIPLYALLPVAGVLLKKGSRISNVLLFLCSSASIRIPLLLFEVSALGWKFTLMRLVMNIAVVFAIAYIIDRTLSEKDRQAIYEKTEAI